MLAVGLSYIAFIMLNYIPSTPLCCEFLSYIDLEFGLMFFTSIEVIFFSFLTKCLVNFTLQWGVSYCVLEFQESGKW